MSDRIVRSMDDISTRVALDDSDSDDSDGEVNRKAKPETKKARLAGLTLPCAQGKELATLTKCMKKGLSAMLLCLSTTELHTLETQYTDEFHAILATNDPRLLLELIEKHWTVTIVQLSKPHRLALAAAAADVVRAGLSHVEQYRRCKMAFDEKDLPDGVGRNLAGAIAWLAGLPDSVRTYLLPAVDRRHFAKGEDSSIDDAFDWEAYARMLDDELKLLPPPAARVATVHTASGKQPKRKSGASAATAKCPTHPWSTHTGDECKNPGRVAASAPASVSGAAGAGAPGIVCRLCDLPGHKSFDCPYMAAAKEAATAAGSAATSKARRKSLSKTLATLGSCTTGKAAKAAKAAPPPLSSEEDDSDEASSGTRFIGLDSMSDSHLISRRRSFVQSSIKLFDPPLIIVGATGTDTYFEYGDVWLNNWLIKDAILCPTAAYDIISAGRLASDFPAWTWSFDRSKTDALRLRARSSSGASRICATHQEDLFLMRCHLGAQPLRDSHPLRTSHQSLRPSDSQRPLRSRYSLPVAVLPGPGLGPPAAVLASALPLDGLAVSVPADCTDPINRPVVLPATSPFARFMYWHRTLGHPSHL